jgi:hypothetical protein
MKRYTVALLTCVSAFAPSAGWGSDDSPSVPPVAVSPESPEKSAEPAIGIRFAGLLPGAVNSKLEGKFRLDLKIYRSPQGGEPIWHERREVDVKGGRIDLTLGEVTKVPMEIHEATFKFLGVSVNGNREVYPRFAVVNVVYASAKEALAGISRRAAAKEAAPPKGTAVQPETQKAATWREALAAACASGGELPDYEAWYGALESSAPDKVSERTGHYEWVLPWVYDPASHGRLNDYFRGRFQGCDYMDLAPSNRYPYRVAVPRKA